MQEKSNLKKKMCVSNYILTILETFWFEASILQKLCSNKRHFFFLSIICHLICNREDVIFKPQLQHTRENDDPNANARPLCEYLETKTTTSMLLAVYTRLCTSILYITLLHISNFIISYAKINTPCSWGECKETRSPFPTFLHSFLASCHVLGVVCTMQQDFWNFL